jgi:hypothetical protein
MKKKLLPFKACLYTMLLLITFQSRANDDPKIEKRKAYSKSYAVSSSDRILVDNQFGEVKISGWDKNEVKVDVTIIAKSATNEGAQEILDRISIEDNKNAGSVSFKTNMKNEAKNKNEKKNNKEEQMEINYMVYMPSSNPLTLSNQFGATIVPDMKGQVDISSKFGTLTAGRLGNVKTVNVEFGTATVESISNGTLIVKFSRAIINKLDGNVDAVFEHSSGIKLGVENSTKELRVTSAFSTVYLDINKDLGATFDINTSFGGLSNKTNFPIQEGSKSESKKPSFNQSYSGRSGNGSTSMKISSSFSQITLGHDLPMDLKENKKQKVI